MNYGELIITLGCIGMCLFMLYYDWKENRKLSEAKQKFYDSLHKRN